MAIDRRPTGIFEDSTQVQAEGGSDSGPHDLQEERFVESLAQESLALDL